MFENSQISNFMKIRLVGVELFHPDRQTHRRVTRQKNTRNEANSRFWQCCELA